VILYVGAVPRVARVRDASRLGAALPAGEEPRFYAYECTLSETQPAALLKIIQVVHDSFVSLM